MNGKRILKLFVCAAVIAAAPLFAAGFAELYPQDESETDASTEIVTEETTETMPPVPLSAGFGDDWNDLYISETESVTETATPVAKPADAGPQPYPESIENRSGKILRVSYSNPTGKNHFKLAGGGQVRNYTTVLNAVLTNQSEMLPDFELTASVEPQVLIVHTHTTESFEPYARDFYDASFNSRTTDSSKNMVAVGKIVAHELESAGIGVIHDTTIHDYPSYNGSYSRSAKIVKAMLKKYPTIKVVLDLHRDAISNNGTRIAPVAQIAGKSAAQIMIISCCDDGSGNIPQYLQNFRLAALLQQQLETDYGGLTRPIMFDCRSYNQELSTGSLLIEIGSCANSLAEAQYSGELFGKSAARALKKLIKNDGG